MNKIIISSEVGCDVDPNLMLEYGIYRIPFYVVYGDRSVLESATSPSEIYDYYQKTKKVPKTSAANPADYTKFFDQITEENPGASILHIAFSSCLSATYQNAIIGAENAKNKNIKIVDSRFVANGIASLITLAKEKQKEDPEISLDDLADYVDKMIAKVRLNYVVETLSYLKAGGRVSNVAAISAALLKIRPKVEFEDGRMVVKDKYRGNMKKVVTNLVESFFANHNLSDEFVYLSYTRDSDLELVDLAKTFLKNHFKKVFISEVGCAITIYAGPNAIVLAGVER